MIARIDRFRNSPQLQFYRIPKERKTYKVILKIETLKLDSKLSRICSTHFEGGTKLSRNPRLRRHHWFLSIQTTHWYFVTKIRTYTPTRFSRIVCRFVLRTLVAVDGRDCLKSCNMKVVAWALKRLSQGAIWLGQYPDSKHKLKQEKLWFKNNRSWYSTEKWQLLSRRFIVDLRTESIVSYSMWAAAVLRC